MRQITLSVSVISLIIVTGCGREVGSRQPMPASTIPVVNHVDNCMEHRYFGLVKVGENRDACMLDPPTTGPGCFDLEDEERAQVYEIYSFCIMQMPLVSYECVSQLSFNGPQDRHDTDGDGVSDYFELEMGLNPCEPCSYGGTPGVDCDGDLDNDRDGYSNDDDWLPMCGQIHEEGQWDANPEGTNGTWCV